jgi:hypothetical protein
MFRSIPIVRAVSLRIAKASSALAIGLSAAGCGPDPTPTNDAGTDGGTDAHLGCSLPFVGDATKEIEIELVALKADYTSAPLAMGDSVALLFPPQGGRVVFAGVRARNLDPCGAYLIGSMRDLVTQQITVDSRTINLRTAEDGWGQSPESDVSSFANVPLCPNQWSKTDIYGTTYALDVTLRDREGRQVTKSINVVPSCAEPDNAAECACICRGGYVLGEQCEAGAPTSSSSGHGSAGGAGGMFP